MPYVQRDKKGIVTGLFEHKLPEATMEFLEKDDPEIKDFYDRFPLSPQMIEALRPKSTKELLEQHQKIEKEYNQLIEDHKALQNLIISLLGVWAEMETSFAGLLNVLLTGSREKLAFALYFSIRNFQTQMTVIQTLGEVLFPSEENSKKVYKEWESVFNKIKKEVPEIRNRIAHGHIVQFLHEKKHIRVLPPFFDFIKIEKSNAKAELPGVGQNEIYKSIKVIGLTSQFANRLSLIFKRSFEGEALALKEIDLELKSYKENFKNLR